MTFVFSLIILIIILSWIDGPLYNWTIKRNLEASKKDIKEKMAIELKSMIKYNISLEDREKRLNECKEYFHNYYGILLG